MFWWQAPSPQKESAQSDVALGVIVIGWRLPITRGRQATEIFRELHLSVKLPVIPRRRGAIVVREEAEGESSTMTALGIARDSAASIADSAMGGSTRAPIMTAYRQQALACASALSKGPQRARDVRARIPDQCNMTLTSYPRSKEGPHESRLDYQIWTSAREARSADAR